jgi:hypothetical protein
VATIVESILARSYAFVVVSLRYLVVGGWAAAVVLAIMFLPPLSATSSGGLSNLIPPGSAAARAEADVAHLFGFPVDAAVAIVQRDPHGMPAVVRDRALRQAIAVDRRLSGQSDSQSDGQLATAAAALARAGHPDAARILSGPVSPGPPGGIPGLAGAFPLPNAAGLLRGTNEQSTTVITFLAFRPGTSFGAQTAGAHAYVRWFLNRPDDHVVGVTGPVPAEYDQSQIIGKRSSRLGLTWADGVWLGSCPQVKRALPTLSGGCRSGSAARGRAWVRAAWLAVPAGVGLGDGEAEGFEFGDELAQAAVIVEPGAVVGELVVGQDAGGGLAVFLAGPLVVGAVEAGRVGVAAAVRPAAAGHPVGEGSGQGKAEGG